MQTLVLTILWMIGILWAMYYWYLSPSMNHTQTYNNAPKVIFDFDSDKRYNTSSVESLEHSDNEDIRRKYIQKLKHETKTRWPSRTSIKPRLYKSF